jgi:hypothetical protein
MALSGRPEQGREAPTNSGWVAAPSCQIGSVTCDLWESSTTAKARP